MLGSSGCVSGHSNDKANHDKSAGMSRDSSEVETRSMTPGDSLAVSSTCLIDNIIDASGGMCLSCNDVRAQDKSISCFLSLKQFHAICRGDGGSCNNINCNKTFLDQFNKRIEKNSLYVYMRVISYSFAPLAKLIMSTKMLHLSNPMYIAWSVK